MNPPSNAVFPFDSQPTASPTMSATRPMYWSVRRELWENRFLYIAPMAITVLVLFGSLISMVISLQRRMNSPSADAAQRYLVVVKPFSMAPAPIMFATLLVGMFYCLDALYGERRDRSILFWKSLPVSDRTTVLAKASVPLVVLPLLALTLSIVTQVIMLFISTFLVMAHGLSPLTLWGEVRFFQGLPIMLYGLAVHALWFAPIYGWLLLVSAWAKRAVLLCALLPMLAVSAVERIAFGTTYFMFMLQYRVTGAMKEAFAFEAADGGNVDRISQLSPARFLTAPGLWVGLAFAAICLTTAVRLRRNREPI